MHLLRFNLSVLLSLLSLLTLLGIRRSWCGHGHALRRFPTILTALLILLTALTLLTLLTLLTSLTPRTLLSLLTLLILLPNPKCRANHSSPTNPTNPKVMGTVKVTEGRLEHVRTRIIVLLSLSHSRSSNLASPINFFSFFAHRKTLDPCTTLRFAPWYGNDQH
jgi:hypothetical protein